MIQNNKIYYTLVALLLVLGFLFRFYGLEQYPLAINQDELSNIYDGYSIAQTGADRFGDMHPVILRGFGKGDFRPSMCAWLVAGSVKLLGFSVFAGRLPSVLLGWCSLLLLWLVAGRLGGRVFALVCLFFAALSPWHILFSRMAHEGAVLPSFFLVLTLYLWLVAKEKQYTTGYLLLLGMAMGLGTNTYQSGKLIFLLFGLLVVYDLYQTSSKPIKYSAVVLAGALLGALPQLMALLGSSTHFFSRARNTMKPASVSFIYIWNLVSDVFSHLSPGFLFVQSGNYNNLSIYRLVPAEAFFFYIGILTLPGFIKLPGVKKRYRYLLLLFALLPAALADPNPHALRASGIIILLPLFSAAGILFIYRYLPNITWKNLYRVVVLAAVTISFGAIVYQYANSPRLRDEGQQHTLVQLSRRLRTVAVPYKAVVVQYGGIQRYLYVAAFADIAPRSFQHIQLVNDTTGDWDRVTQMGKYYFADGADSIGAIAQQYTGNRLLVTSDAALPYLCADSLQNETEKIYFYRY